MKYSLSLLGILKDPLAMGYLFERLSTQELTKFNHPFLMAGRAKVPAFAGKWKQIFMVASQSHFTRAKPR
jgi:hypothetical protein